jgi:hypothetical protein
MFGGLTKGVIAFEIVGAIGKAVLHFHARRTAHRVDR